MKRKVQTRINRMNLDKLARITQEEFLAVRRVMATKDELTAMRKEMATKDELTAMRKEMATKDELTAMRKEMATKEDLHVLKEEMRTETVKILRGVDKIITRFDIAEKEHAAHTILHKRITDELHSHDKRLKVLESNV